MIYYSERLRLALHVPSPYHRRRSTPAFHSDKRLVGGEIVVNFPKIGVLYYVQGSL